MQENNFKIGDKVRIRTSVTLEEIKKDLKEFSDEWK